ncbi:ribonuclease G [Parvibium lacunae]|uniref:Ribonuclease G n=1 Tax=Parvibium lacunae TaxID=1888893 RepID=A0A368L467_9BURK|nr:ribonuclease G [Parvibium lacunae]RCS58315.1 ribonuclease G [Parvibium lacunae]
MTQQILINITPQETRVAIVERGAVQEIHVERSLTRGLVGNIYLGRVIRVLPGMQSAFIDIGLEKAAFLHVADIWENRQSDLRPASDTHKVNKSPGLPIEKQLFEGQAILVQVLKDPIGTKGARLTTQISIAGRMLVYLPQEQHIGVSQKIDNDEERLHLKNRMQALLPPESRGGFIVRTMAEGASEQDLQADIAYLHKRWAEISQASRQQPAPNLLYTDLNLAQRVLRDLVTDHTANIQIDSRENFAVLQEFARIYTPSVVEKLELYRGERPLFDLHNVEQEIERALSRKVGLKSGGYLIIDQTEAMTTIDVNTGGYVGARNFEETIFKTNLEAAQMIARQLRLRNLGGIIILDFIDMAQSEHRETVLSELRRALAADRTKVTVHGFSPLGLVEMTRKRTRESLAHILCEPCPTCAGNGEVKTPQTVCYEILREVLREARQFNPREFRIIAAPNVVEMFLEEESSHLAALSDFIGKPIALQAESFPSQEQYDIVLL